MLGHRTGAQNGVRDPRDGLARVLTRPGEQIRSLRRAQMVQRHQDPDRSGDSLVGRKRDLTWLTGEVMLIL